MNDRAVELLEQYEIEVLRTRKGRSAFLCDTDKGCLVFQEYRESAEQVRLQDALLHHLAGTCPVRTEEIIPSREGELLVTDADGVRYILKTRREGRECAVYDKAECTEAVRLLAKLHRCMQLPADTPGIPVRFSPAKEYEKHNRELKKLRKYLRQKGQKQTFERNLLNECDYFLQQGLEVAGEWGKYSEVFEKRTCAGTETEMIAFCHGDFQYHNILMTGGGWFLVGFDHCQPDDPVRDLCLFLRKLMEKANWSVSLGRELLGAYEKERPLSAQSRIDLCYRLSYPEKFWKIANFYYNSKKAWIPGKNQEKLDKLIAQEKAKQEFLDCVFRNP